MNKSKGILLRNRSIFVALFAALMAVSGFIVIPLPGGVPIVLKNLFVVLAGTVLGRYYGGLAALVLLGAGILGLPVFVIPGGLGVFLTNLGGYLIGYFTGSLAAGLIAGMPRAGERKSSGGRWLRLGLASFCGFALILLSGALYMMALNSISFRAAFAAGVVPFIAVDMIKFVISVPLAMKLRPIAARYINSPDA